MADSSEPHYGPDRETELAHLSSCVGHYVINAFSAIVSNAEILKLNEDQDDGDSAEVNETIINAAIRASGIARRMIHFTRPSTQPQTQQLLLKPILEAAITEVSRDSLGSGLDWSVSLGSSRAIPGIPSHLKSMIVMLLANACEAVGPDSGRIAIALSEHDGQWFDITITDNGEGMNAESQERAFEPFYSTKNGHLGLGLSLANSIWRRHGGTVSVRSQPGEGTTFRMIYSYAS